MVRDYQNEAHQLKHLKHTRERLDEVSPSFCLAKWEQVTLHLQNGHNHSCHHPATHRADPAEVAKNPAALHNTEHKKHRRWQMLNGQFPPECEYCWTVERNSSGISDRILKSASDWAAPRYDQVLTAGSEADVLPSYVEVSFSNVCNFKCSYCAPHISSKWMEEIRQHGAYPTSSRFNGLDHLTEQGAIPIPEREDNPYVDAFWKWWPDLYPQLTDFRITGGEPLLSKHTFRVMEHILRNPNPNFRFSVNTNLCVPGDVYKRFLELIREIYYEKACADFILYTSADTHGERADYIRNGMDYLRWLENLRTYYEKIPKAKASIMCTFNALSPYRFESFYDNMMGFRKAGHRLGFDISHLSHPRHQHMWILPSWAGAQIEKIRDHIHASPHALPMDRIKIDRILELFHNRTWTEEELRLYRKDFGLFIAEHDRRRNTDFSTVFPELVPFYRECLTL